MPRTAKEHALESLHGIENELASRKGKSVLSGLKPEHKEEMHTGAVESEPGEHHEGKMEKEVESHLVHSGQFDCPHCGGGIRVKE